MLQLTETPLFRGMTEAEICGLLACLSAGERRYARGERILTAGDPCPWMGLVLSGRVLVELSDAWGNDSVLGAAGEGEVFAEAYACAPGEPLLVNVTASEESTVLLLDAGRLLSPCESFCSGHALLLRRLLALCARKNLQLSQRALHTAPKTIRGRLMSYLSECAVRSGSSSFDIPYDRRQLAGYLGVERSALCAELSRMASFTAFFTTRYSTPKSAAASKRTRIASIGSPPYI